MIDPHLEQMVTGMMIRNKTYPRVRDSDWPEKMMKSIYFFSCTMGYLTSLGSPFHGTFAGLYLKNPFVMPMGQPRIEGGGHCCISFMP